MKLHPDTQKAGEKSAAEITNVSMRDWRLAILVLLQELDRVADGYDKQSEFHDMLVELRYDIRARIGVGHW